MYTKSSLWAIARTLRCGCQAMHLMQSCSGCDKSVCGPFSSFPTKCFCAKSYASWIILDKVLKKRKKKWIRNGCCITALNTYVSPALFLIFDILKCFFFQWLDPELGNFASIATYWSCTHRLNIEITMTYIVSPIESMTSAAVGDVATGLNCIEGTGTTYRERINSMSTWEAR